MTTDGDIDLVLLNYWGYNEADPESGTVAVLLNNGDATFAPPASPAARPAVP